MRFIQGARCLLVAVSPPVLPIVGGTGAIGVGTPDVPQSIASSSSSSAGFQVGMLFIFFNQWRTITSKRFVINMVWGHHIQLRTHPPLFHNFQQFNVKAAAAHHSIIQKEVDGLFSKGAIGLSSGGAGFYSSMFVIPKCTGGLWPYLPLNHLIIICIYLLLRCLLSDMCSSLFSIVIMLSPLIYRMLFHIFPLLNIIAVSYDLFGTTCLISGRFYFLGWPQSLRFSEASLNLFCSFAITRVSILLSIWKIFRSWFALSGQVRGCTHYLCS